MGEDLISEAADPSAPVVAAQEEPEDAEPERAERDPVRADADRRESDAQQQAADPERRAAEREQRAADLGLPRRETWRRRTASGAILSGLAFGFQQVFEPKKEDITLVVEASGIPPTDLPVEAEFDGMAPRRSIVKIRPWLLSRPLLGDPIAPVAPVDPGDPGNPHSGDHPVDDEV